MSSVQSSGIRPTRPRQSGFTLIELMVVIVVMGVLTALAAPSFQDFFERYRVSAAVDEFNASLQLARIEAIRTNQQVVLRRQVGCATNNWGCGWVVFRDVNSNLVLEPGPNPTDDVLLQTTDVQPSVSITSTTGTPDTLVINSFGQTANGFRRMNFGPVGNASSRGCTRLNISIALRVQSTVGTGMCP